MPSIEKAVGILKLVAQGIHRISDISDKLNLSKGTAHRLISQLDKEGLVVQDPVTRLYYLGPLVSSLSSSPEVGHQSLVVSAFEGMTHLRDITGETVVLHIRIGVQRICLEEIPSLQSIKYVSGKGAIASVFTGAAGKILLSRLNDNEINGLMKNTKLVKVGPNTITDKKKFEEELDKVRRQGYATSFGERVAGSATLSVHVDGYISPIALSVLGPDSRFSGKMMSYLRDMKAISQKISKNLQAYKR